MAYYRFILIVGLTLVLIACEQPSAAVAPQPLAPTTLTWHATLTDTHTGQPVQATVYVDDQPRATQVSVADVPVPADGQKHWLRVEAAGYKSWKVYSRGSKAGPPSPGAGTVDAGGETVLSKVE